MKKEELFKKRVLSLMNLQENKKKVNGFGCVMLNVDFPEFDELKEKIESEDLYIDPKDDSFGLETSAHTTLLYGLHENVKDEDVVEIVEKFDFEPIKIGNISLFENELYDVLKFDVEKNKSLIECNEELRKLPHTNQYKDYHPHLTVAYLLPGKGKKYVEMFSDLEFELQPVEIEYSKIDGSSEVNYPRLKPVGLLADFIIRY